MKILESFTGVCEKLAFQLRGSTKNVQDPGLCHCYTNPSQALLWYDTDCVAFAGYINFYSHCHIKEGLVRVVPIVNTSYQPIHHDDLV